jgi:hypothetical protein
VAASALYRGFVSHRRHAGVAHRFRARLCMLYLDLDELPDLLPGRWLWSATRTALVRFDRRDHLGDPCVPLGSAVRDLVQERTGHRPEGPIRLLTQPRWLGYVFNPISVYYCFARDGRTLDAVVAEVTNTPWKERHCYVLDGGTATSDGRELRAECAKRLHVSPFLPMDLVHEFRVGVPGERLRLAIDDRRGSERAFSARLELERHELSRRALAGALVRYPFMTGQIVASIYWQALRLWWKGARFHAHPSGQPRAQSSQSIQSRSRSAAVSAVKGR